MIFDTSVKYEVLFYVVKNKKKNYFNVLYTV